MSKKLQIDYIHIKKVQFGNETSLADGILTVNREELLRLIETPLLIDTEIELAAPGEDCRILGILDTMQPRCKADQPEISYPGMLGKMAPVGEGRTIALKGVLITDLYRMKMPVKNYLDMGGECAAFSQFSKQYHLTLTAKPADGVTDLGYATALKEAALKLNVFLARLGIGQTPDETEVLDHSPVDPEKHLPRVAYFLCLMAGQDTMSFNVYGQSAQNYLPTILQPTEVLDGALITRYWETNYAFQTEGYIKELLKRHGKDLDFAGVVIANNVMKSDGKNAMGMMGASLCKHTLQADCVLVNKCGMGHSQLDANYNYNWCENFGMPAVMNLAAVSNETPGDMLVISDPKVNAVINSGRNYMLKHPRVERMIGGDIAVPSLMGIDPQGPFEHTTNYAYFGIWSQLGDFYVTSE